MCDASAGAGTRPSWLDDALYPFRSRFLTVGGHVVHYVDEGRGPTLLMLHGNPTWSFVYRDVIVRLRDSFRCVALDYPGFGLSQAAAGYDFRPESHAAVVAAVVEALDLRGATLVVQDWGGPIGLHVAEAAPERFAGFVIGNTWAWPVANDLHFVLFARMMGGPLGRLLIRRANLFVNLMLPIGHRRRLSAQEMRHYRAPFPTAASRQPTAVLPHAILAAHDFLRDVHEGLARIAHLPALVVWADKDIAFRDKERKRWESTFPSHRTVQLPGAGHFLQSDDPDAFATAIHSWFWRDQPEDLPVT